MTQDEKADAVIATMTGGTIFLAAMPPVVDMAAFAAAVGGGVVAIGGCYGDRISKEEAVQLTMDFIKFGGVAFAGGKLISGVLKATGLAYAAGGAIDAALYSAMSYAIGVTAKAWFKGERDPNALKKILKGAYKSK